MNPRHLEKIKKCFDLSQSGNAHEAANALAMAHKLMRKFGLSDEDIQFIEMGETASKSRIQRKPVLYITALLSNISNSFGVAPLLTQTYEGAFPCFIGRKDAAMMAAYAFDVLYRQLKLARKAYLATLHPQMLRRNKTVRADRYCEGWVVAVVKNLNPEELPKEERDRIKAYRKHKEGNSYSNKPAKTTRRKGGSSNDFLNGAKDGSRVNVNTPVNGTETMKLQCVS